MQYQINIDKNVVSTLISECSKFVLKLDFVVMLVFI